MYDAHIEFLTHRHTRDTSPSNSLVTRDSLDNVRITRVNNAEAAHSIVLPTCGAKINIISIKMMNSNLGQHSIVLNQRLAQRRAVVRNDDQLTFGVPEGS